MTLRLLHVSNASAAAQVGFRKGLGFRACQKVL